MEIKLGSRTVHVKEVTDSPFKEEVCKELSKFVTENSVDALLLGPALDERVPSSMLIVSEDKDKQIKMCRLVHYLSSVYLPDRDEDDGIFPRMRKSWDNVSLDSGFYVIRRDGLWKI